MLNFLTARLDPGLFGVIAGLAGVCGIYGPLLVLIFAMKKVARGGSYERRSGTSYKIYSPPPGFAFGAIGFMLSYPVLVSAILPHSVWEPVFQRWAAPGHPGMARDLLLAICVVGLACWGAVRWLRGYALTLNLQERTYRSVDSGGLSLKARSGSWQDIAGVYIYNPNCSRPEAGLAYFVCLKLIDDRKVYSALGGFRRREQAEAFAAKMARELGLPLISDTWQQAKKGQRRRGF